MTCNACGEKPKNTAKDFTKAVIEINNPEEIVLLRKVVVPASMGDDNQVPPAVGKYRNVILQYEANKHVYLYSSDGIPTFIEAEDTSGGDSDIIELTRADYNYPEDNPNSIALWKLESGIYRGTGITVKPNVGASTTIAIGASPKSYFYIKNNSLEANILFIKPSLDMLSRYKTNVADGAMRSSTSFTVLDTLTSTRDDCALSANQGKVLDRKIGDLSTLVTTNKSSAVAAINEIASGGGGQSYTAGDGIDITNNTISVDTDVIQPKLTAGTNITIDENNIISAQGGSSVNVTQTTGQSTTDVMSQKTVTDMVFAENSTGKIQIGSTASASAIGNSSCIAIGTGASATQNDTIAIGSTATSNGSNSMAIGRDSVASNNNAVALGRQTTASGENSIAIGWKATATQKGQFDISTGTNQTAGYNSSNYRLITGVYDPQSAHDAATKGYVDTAVAGVSTNTINSIDWSTLWQ